MSSTPRDDGAEVGPRPTDLEQDQTVATSSAATNLGPDTIENATPQQRGVLATSAIEQVCFLLDGMNQVREACEAESPVPAVVQDSLQELRNRLVLAEHLCRVISETLIAPLRPSLDESMPNTLEAAVRLANWMLGVADSIGVRDQDRRGGKQPPYPIRDDDIPLVAAAIRTHCPAVDNRKAVNDIRREMADWLRRPPLSVPNPWREGYGWRLEDWAKSLFIRPYRWPYLQSNEKRLKALREAGAREGSGPPEWATAGRAPQRAKLLSCLWKAHNQWVGEKELIQSLDYTDPVVAGTNLEMQVYRANIYLSEKVSESQGRWTIEENKTPEGNVRYRLRRIDIDYN